MSSECVAVRYVGYFAENSGYGVAARYHAEALAAVGVRVFGRGILFWPSRGIFDMPPSREQSRVVRDLCALSGECSTTILHTMPSFFPALRSPRGRNIGVSVWEGSRLPQNFCDALGAVDELWVASEFSVEAFARATRAPVVVVPHPVRPPRRCPRSFPGIPDDLFLFVSILEWQERKNPLGMARAFGRAFRGRSDVGLAMKVGRRLGGEERQIAAQLQEALGSGATPPLFLILGADASGGLVERLYSRADAYLSLHRAEGFGLCLAEAMAAGLPVVATGYSGSLEYMDARSAFLVDHSLVPARETLASWTHYDARMLWAEPDPDQAVDVLRSCVDDSARRQRVARAGQLRVKHQLSPRRIGALMRARLSVGSE